MINFNFINCDGFDNKYLCICVDDKPSTSSGTKLDPTRNLPKYLLLLYNIIIIRNIKDKKNNMIRSKEDNPQNCYRRQQNDDNITIKCVNIF